MSAPPMSPAASRRSHPSSRTDVVHPAETPRASEVRRPIPTQQPLASRSRRHACAIRLGDTVATRRRNESRRIVWMLSRFTTQSLGTPSSSTVSSSSDTSPRFVRVNAATTTAPIRSATGSRVRTSTGRSPPGVAANQMSPRCIGPVRPILGWSPVGDLGERRLGTHSAAGRSRPERHSQLRVERDDGATPLSATPIDRRRVIPPTVEHEWLRRRRHESSSSSYRVSTTYDSGSSGDPPSAVEAAPDRAGDEAQDAEHDTQDAGRPHDLRAAPQTLDRGLGDIGGVDGEGRLVEAVGHR